MQRYPVLAALLGLALISRLLIAIAGGSPFLQGPVYTVAQLQAGLADQPQAWVGRTVRVRGVAEACLPSGSPAHYLYCRSRPQDLLDPGLAGARTDLPLVWSSQSSWLAFLRRLPVFGTLLPAAQAPHWGADAVYRVQLRAVPAGSCASLPCYQALLLDAAP